MSHRLVLSITDTFHALGAGLSAVLRPTLQMILHSHCLCTNTVKVAPKNQHAIQNL